MGELDHHGARQTMVEIIDRIDLNLPRSLVLDMSGLTFMDSSGIAVVLKSYKSMKELGGTMLVVNVPRQAMKVLDASGIQRIISISAIAD
jgi:stage II sporulation protein AA (anti-sigma F factor antagonist)